MATGDINTNTPRGPAESLSPHQPPRGNGDHPAPRPSGLSYLVGATFIVGILYAGRGVLIPLAIAILLTFLLAPLVTRLQRLHVGRVLAVLLVAALAFLVVGALALLLGVQAMQLASDLPSYQTNLLAKLHSLRDAAPGGGVFEQLTDMFQTLRAEATEPDPEAPPPEVPVVQVQEAPPSAFNVIAQFMAPLLGPLGKAGIVIVLVIFMLLEREDLRNRLIRLLGPNMNMTTEVLDEAGTRVSQYLLMQLVVNVTFGIPLGIGLYLIGIPNALLWAVLAVILRFIPYLGPLLSAAFPLLLAVAVHPGWNTVLLTLGLILTLELISNNFIEPWLYGSSTNMSAVAIIFAAIFWTALWGPVGLLLATPLTVCLSVAGRYFPQIAFLDVLLGRAPALSLPERLYQRLLAGDTVESTAIAEDYIDDDHDYLQLYDDVVLPALRNAAVDHARYGLTAERRLIVMRTVMELIRELGDRDEPSKASAAQGADAGAEPRSVLCVAGHSALDLAVAAALEQLLERRGFKVRLVSAEALAPEHLHAAGLGNVDAVCLSYLDPSPPARVTQTVRRIARHAREVPVLIGLWSLPGQPTGRLASLPSHASVVPTLREALQRVELATARSLAYTPAPVPSDEEDRLADLHRLRALEASDERLERFTRRLSKAFDVPIALFNLIDGDSQHFKGQVGLPEDLASTGTSPRDLSICGYVVVEDDIVIIEDALKNPRFAQNPLLLEHGIRFYAGVPLRSHRGHAIGSLCVMDASPRTVTEDERALLLALAEEAMAELEEEAAVAEFSPRAASDADDR